MTCSGALLALASPPANGPLHRNIRLLGQLFHSQIARTVPQMTLDPSRVAQRSPTLITATWPTAAQASGHAYQIASRIATTPCPPAAQMEISPMRQLFCKRADNTTARRDR